MRRPSVEVEWRMLCDLAGGPREFTHSAERSSLEWKGYIVRVGNRSVLTDAGRAAVVGARVRS